MQHLTWTKQEASAILGAMTHVLTEASTKPLNDIQLSFMKGVNQYLLESTCQLDTIEACQPKALSDALQEESKRLRAIQLLIVLPYLDIDISNKKVEIVDEYADALSIHPDTLKTIHHLKDKHLKIMQFCLVRKTMPILLNKKSLTKNLATVWNIIKESKPNPDLAEKYTALEKYPTDTLGYNFFKFYRSRGFPFPGEKHAIPSDLVVTHDISHILGGFNTDEEGEILVSAFQGGYAGKHGFALAIIGLLDFHCGIPYDTAGVVMPQKGKLVHSDLWLSALRLGMDCNKNFYDSDFDPWVDFKKPIDALRQQYGLENAKPWHEIIDNPPNHPSADARAQGSN